MSDDSDEAEHIINNMIRPQPILELVARVGHELSYDEVKAEKPDIVWICVPSGSGGGPQSSGYGLSTLRVCMNGHHDACYWVSYSGDDPDVVRTAFRFGAADCFELKNGSASAAVTTAINRLITAKTRE